jgi:HK97 family phage major capsid protein
LQQLASEASALFDKADAEGRQLTPAEREEAQEKVARFKDLQARQQAFDVAGQIGNPDSEAWTFGGDAGKAFTASAGYKAIRDPAMRGQTFTSGAVEVPLMTKGTLLEGPGAPGTGTGGGLLPAPDVRPGVVQKLLAPPLGVADLFGQATATTNTVRVVVEGTATSAAAGVAEGAAKPESTLALSTVDEPVRKIATSLVVSDEVLDDAAATQGFVNGELTRFVKIEEERQLLRGSTANEIPGLVGRSGVNTYSKPAADDNTVALARVIANTRGSSYVEPDAIIMSPVNWLSSRLLRDGAGGTVGQYLAGGPFTGAYGTSGAPGLFGGELWNKPVVLSDVVGAGTAIVGNFGAAATLYRRGGLTVEATNSHSDLFVKDLTTFRAEMREALAIYYANAFTVVSGLS